MVRLLNDVRKEPGRPQDQGHRGSAWVTHNIWRGICDIDILLSSLQPKTDPEYNIVYSNILLQHVTSYDEHDYVVAS